jgi:hypothetical protein
VVANGYTLTVGYSCGVVLMQWVTVLDAVRELVCTDVLYFRTACAAVAPPGD